jgi:hypothetical protein
MLKTYEAVLEPDGHLHFLEAGPTLDKVARRVLVTFTQETAPVDTALCGASLSEKALAEDWTRSEEDAAWAHLQAAK